MEKAKILVVEDEGITAEDIKDYLIGLGYDVLGISSTGEDAIQKVRDLVPDLVLMDIMLAGVIDGTQAAEIVREQYGTPVVFLTAYSDPETLNKAKVSDPYGYVLKPFDQRDLQIAIEIALHKHLMQRKIIESERWLSTTVASVHEALIAVDSMYRVITMNESAEKLTGWKQDEAKGRLFSQVYTTCDATTGEDLDTPVHLAFEEGQTVSRSGDAILIAKGGLVYPVDETASLIVDNIKGVQGAVIVFRDATPRIRETEDYREDLVPAVLDSLSALLVVTDKDGKIIRFNEKAQEITGLTTADVSDKYFWELCSNAEDSDFANTSLKSLHHSKLENKFDCSWKTKFDENLKIRWCNSAIREGDEDISYIICTGIDMAN